jgi:ATP-binding cassette subfamily B multidrug efflux pump
MFRKVQKANDHMASVTRENAQGIRVIKALSRTDYEKNHFAKVNDALKNEEVHANLVMAVINPLMNLFLYAGMVGVIILGAYRVNAGLSETGKILAFMSYFQMISHSLMAISRMFIMYSRGMASSERIMEVLNTENEKNWQPANEPDGDPQYALEFKDVSFSYLKVKG